MGKGSVRIAKHSRLDRAMSHRDRGVISRSFRVAYVISNGRMLDIGLIKLVL